MKSLAMIIALLFSLVLPAEAGREKLIGTFKSNKEATLNHLRKHVKLTPEQWRALKPVLGRMTVTCDEHFVIYQDGGWRFSSAYKLISQHKNRFVIESNDPRTRKIVRTTIDVDETGFWSSDDRIPGYKERFDKVLPESTE